MSGQFIPVEIHYGDNSQESIEQQARRILSCVRACRQVLKEEKVGIIYSANHDQSVKIRQAYKNNQWKSGITGGNQAAVVAAIESLLEKDEFKELQNVFCILPISTCAEMGGKGRVKDIWLEDELKNIEEFLDNDKHVVLGWQNQLTADNKDHPYAIGGGFSQMLTSDQKNLIQNNLKKFAKDFKARIFFPLPSEEPLLHKSKPEDKNKRVRYANPADLKQVKLRPVKTEDGKPKPIAPKILTPALKNEVPKTAAPENKTIPAPAPIPALKEAAPEKPTTLDSAINPVSSYVAIYATILNKKQPLTYEDKFKLFEAEDNGRQEVLNLRASIEQNQLHGTEENVIKQLLTKPSLDENQKQAVTAHFKSLFDKNAELAAGPTTPTTSTSKEQLELDEGYARLLQYEELADFYLSLKKR